MSNDDSIHFCKNLSNCHILKDWQKWSLTKIVEELSSLERCPPDMRDSILIGKNYK